MALRAFRSSSRLSAVSNGGSFIESSHTATCSSAWIEIIIRDPSGSFAMSTGNSSSGSEVVPVVWKR